MSQHSATGDMPQITSSLYGSSTNLLTLGESAVDFDWGGIQAAAAEDPVLRRIRQKTITTTDTDTMPNQSTTRRLIQVFIADPDPNVPLDRALLYKGELKFTDSTDQELYFEVPIVDLLAKHNAERLKWPDKEASKRAGKDVMLEPARVRDLRMVVVTVASF